ncbi:MAG: pyrroline-5-carboxylate reductase [Gammaproteobacteria bacterium]|nr:pyrroline-5-carboxylate reductase [Gammaproteobacteria bacterium]
MRNPSQIAFLGAGNLAQSLVAGLLAQGHPAAALRATRRGPEQQEALRTRFGIAADGDNREAAAWAELVVLAVKPQQLAALCAELAAVDFTGKLVISVAAGATTALIAKHLGQSPAMVRAMPNTPSRIGLGATGLYATPAVSPAQKAEAEALFQAVGTTAWLADEGLMDVVTAVAGSGPAYYFAFMEAMQAAAVNLGLDEATARILVKQTALGAVSLAERSAEDLAELRRQVTSKGGTTAAALARFEAGDLNGLVLDALSVATARGRELAQALD